MRLRTCFFAAAVLFWPAVSAASDPAAAREQLKIGYTLKEEGKCQEAVPHLVESLRLDPKAITLINLADCEEKVGKLADAMSHWVDARARAQSEGARPIEEEAEKRASALDARLARLTIVVAPGAPKDVVIERDQVVLGGPSLGIPLPVDPGAHTIVVKAKGRPDRRIDLALHEGESQRVEVDAAAPAPVVAPRPAEPAPSGYSPLMYGGFGLAATGLAVGAVTGILAMSAGSSAKTDCPDLRCSRQSLDDIESGRTLGTVSTIAFAVAGVGAAVGIYGLVWGGKNAAVNVAVGPTQVGLRGHF